MTIAVDFDGTIVEHAYPAIGRELPFATETLRWLIADRHRLILWSVREGKLLEDAIEWCRERGVEFWVINRDYPEEEKEKNNHFSRKLKVDLWIDDRNIGGLPDWGTIYHMITEHRTWAEMEELKVLALQASRAGAKSYELKVKCEEHGHHHRVQSMPKAKFDWGAFWKYVKFRILT